MILNLSILPRQASDIRCPIRMCFIMLGGYESVPTCIEQEARVLLGPEIELHPVWLAADVVGPLRHKVVENVLWPKESRFWFLGFCSKTWEYHKVEKNTVFVPLNNEMLRWLFLNKIPSKAPD